MGRRKSHASSKRKQQRQLSLVERNEINALCDEVFLSASTDTECVTQLWDKYVKISTILEKVKQLEEMKTELPKRSQGIGQFMNWLKENGANVDGVSVSEFPGYDLGLKAEQDFHENELMLRIPRKLIFSTQSAAPELSVLRYDPLIHHMPHVALAIALLIERHKENSKWKPYLDILPMTYSNALYMTAADMAELKGSPTFELALKLCRNIARQYSYFNQIFQNVNTAISDILRDVFTYERYCWAASTVMSRQNLIPSEDRSSTINALIPLWDMCNHENGRITTDFNMVTNSCECYAQRDFKKGEQIFICYGPRTNSDFFLHSGFVYMDNNQDGFHLRLGISQADPLRTERIELLNKLNLSVGEFLLNPGSEPISDLLLAFLRVFSLRKPELMHWIRSDRVEDLKHVDCALETAVEENVRKFLLTRLQLLIANYPTTLKEDLQLLENTLPQIKKLAIQLRVTEKRILQSVLEYVEQWIKA